MNVLEKILEELENESQLAHEEMRRCARGNPLQFDEVKEYARAMEYVIDAIRSRMDEQEVFKFDFNRVKSFDCQCGRHYVNTYDGGWILVDERLPEARQHDNGEPIEFIAMIKGAEVPTVLSINEQDEWFSYDEMFYGEGCYNNYDVVAWKPLPEPYIKNPK